MNSTVYRFVVVAKPMRPVQLYTVHVTLRYIGWRASICASGIRPAPFGISCLHDCCEEMSRG